VDVAHGCAVGPGPHDAGQPRANLLPRPLAPAPGLDAPGMPPLQTDDAQRISAVIDRLADKVEALGREAARRDGVVSETLRSVTRDLDRVTKSLDELWSKINSGADTLRGVDTRVALLEQARSDQREERREDRRDLVTVTKTQARWGGGIAVALVVFATVIGPIASRLIAHWLLGGSL